MLQQLWADRYRPRLLSDLTYHPQITQTLKDLANTNDFPHMIFYGPEGAGKKTRVMSFIKQVYGLSTLTLVEQLRSFKLQSPNKTIEYNLISSNVHIEITPADNEYDDRHIIQRVVKDIASSKQINAKSAKKFKVLVINEADKLSKQAQGSLRRTMEKYMGSCRMILICKHIHKLIAPIRSRCINIRIPSPSEDSIRDILYSISKQQSFDVGGETLQKIISISGRNLRDAISQLECYKYSKKSDSMIMHPYKPQIKEICKLIMGEQSPSQLLKIRGILYELLVNCIEPNLILKLLVQQLVFSSKILDEALKGVIQKAATLEESIVQGSKPIVHLECFVAHVMHTVMLVKQSN